MARAPIPAQGYDSSAPGPGQRVLRRPRVCRAGLPGPGPAGLRRGQVPRPALSGTGLSRRALPRTSATRSRPYPEQAYPEQAYPEQAYPEQAYPEQAYPSRPIPSRPYPEAALSRAGLSRAGLSRAGLSRAGRPPGAGVRRIRLPRVPAARDRKAPRVIPDPGTRTRATRRYGRHSAIRSRATPQARHNRLTQVRGTASTGMPGRPRATPEPYPDQGYTTFGYGGQDPVPRGGRRQNHGSRPGGHHKPAGHLVVPL